MTTKPASLEDVSLGATYRDLLFGTEGVATGVARYLTGCDQVCLSRAKADGDPKGDWLDVSRVVMVRPPAPEVARAFPNARGRTVSAAVAADRSELPVPPPGGPQSCPAPTA